MDKSHSPIKDGRTSMQLNEGENFWKKHMALVVFPPNLGILPFIYPDSNPMKKNSRKTTKKVVPFLIRKPIVPMSAF